MALLTDISRFALAGPAHPAHFEPHILALVLALRHPSRAHLQSARQQPQVIARGGSAHRCQRVRGALGRTSRVR